MSETVALHPNYVWFQRYRANQLRSQRQRAVNDAVRALLADPSGPNIDALRQAFEELEGEK